MNARTLMAAAAALAATAAVMPAGTLASPSSADLTIHHQLRGCHAWSLNGGPYRVRQVVKLAPGGSLLITNNDLMRQDLMKTNGSAVVMKLVRQSHMGDKHMLPMEGKPSPYVMGHMGAQLRVTFLKPGTYRFNLIDRGDYYKGVETIGPDNHPTLVVTIS